MTTPKWGGRKAQAWKRAVLAEHGTRCALRLPGCLGHAATADHIVPRSVDLSLQYDVGNGRPACLPCNVRRSNTPDAARLRVDARSFFENSETPRKGTRPSPPRVRNKNAATTGNGGRR
jgi:hypothetical protein